MDPTTACSHHILLRQSRPTRMPMVDLIVSQLLTRTMLFQTALMGMWAGLPVILHTVDLISMTTSTITHRPSSVQRLADLHRWTDVVV
jgi:hypothetical protein